MSQPKNETLVLVLALLITLGLVGGGVWWFTNSSGVKVGDLITPNKENPGSTTPTNQSIQDRISFGEKTLIPGVVPPAKRSGVEAIAAGTYDKAIANHRSSSASESQRSRGTHFPQQCPDREAKKLHHCRVGADWH